MKQEQGTAGVPGNEKEQQGVTNTLCDSDIAANLSAPSDKRKRCSSLPFSEAPVKKRQTGMKGDTTGTSNPAGQLSKPYAQGSQPCA